MAIVTRSFDARRRAGRLAGYNDLLFAVSRGYDTGAIASMFPVAVQEDIFNDLHRRAVQVT